MRLRREGLGAIGLLLAGLALAVSFGLGGAARHQATSTAPSPTAGRTALPSRIAALDPASGLPTIRTADLPPEARAVLVLIAAGGPYRYPADGATFQNRERLLPPRSTGSYLEYTVETPGSADRGARRIVTGGPDEAYWTADHYATFARIVP